VRGFRTNILFHEVRKVNFNIEVVVYILCTFLEKTRMNGSSIQGVGASITAIDVFLALFIFRDLRVPV
jgi:hypothetical protein